MASNFLLYEDKWRGPFCLFELIDDICEQLLDLDLIELASIGCSEKRNKMSWSAFELFSLMQCLAVLIFSKYHSHKNPNLNSMLMNRW